MKTETLWLHVMPNKINDMIFSDLKNKQINVDFLWIEKNQRLTKYLNPTLLTQHRFKK